MVETLQRRIPQLDGLRAVAILSVIVAHVFGTPLLWMGVDLFFVLSGFLITGILLRRKDAGLPYFSYFYARRALRILPAYGVFMLVFSSIFGTEWMKQWQWFAFFGMNISAAQGRVGSDGLVVLWSLAVEEQFYLFWPLVVRFISERSLVRVSAIVLVLVPALRAIATPFFATHFPIYFLTPFRMDLLCAGALIAVVYRKHAAFFERLTYPAWLLAFCVGTLLLFLSRFADFQTSSNTVWTNTFLYSFILVLVASVLVAALGGKGTLNRVLTWPPLQYVGVISYSMYLIHASAILLSLRYFNRPLAIFLSALGMTTVYATATWFGFERRLLRPAFLSRPRQGELSRAR
jgi:peptidoglycan/LPS O-acetylase OafA/YrhL